MDGTVVDIGGIGIFFVEHGKGIPILYVHGNTGSGRWFERAMDIPGVRTVALDMPNFGRSNPLPGEPDIDRYADAVATFIRELGLDRPVLVGHSLGGAVAISLAARFPRLIRALVLVDSAAPSGLVTPRDRHPVIEMMRTNRTVLAQALRAVVPTLADEVFFQSLVEDAARMAAPAWVGNAEALGRFDYRGRTASFTGPVLVAWGRKDIIITEAMARETAAAFPDARLEIMEDIGHSVMAENPKRFVSILNQFLRDRRLAS
jgi:branched-chain amino acid transport system permease protein